MNLLMLIPYSQTLPAYFSFNLLPTFDSSVRPSENISQLSQIKNLLGSQHEGNYIRYLCFRLYLHMYIFHKLKENVTEWFIFNRKLNCGGITCGLWNRRCFTSNTYRISSLITSIFSSSGEKTWHARNQVKFKLEISFCLLGMWRQPEGCERNLEDERRKIFWFLELKAHFNINKLSLEISTNIPWLKISFVQCKKCGSNRQGD